MSIPTRRDFLMTLGAAAALSASGLHASIPAAAGAEGFPPTEFFPNRQPFGKSAFYTLPLTSVRPKGWLLKQLEIQANGLGGHLDEFWPDVGPESGWLGGNGESWERGPYFLDGLGPLAYLLGDGRLKAKAQKYIDWTLDNQAASGMFGPRSNDDWWPRFVMLKVVTQYQDGTGGPRV